MPGIPKWMHKLDAALDALPDDNDPMTLSQIDGFLAGILVCPELIPPGEWLPNIWNLGGNEDFAFEDEAQLQAMIDLIMRHYDLISHDLAKGLGSYSPVFDEAPGLDEPVCVFWLDGFSVAVTLRPDSWLEILEGDDEEAAAALSMLLALCHIDDGSVDMPDDAREELVAEGPDLIVECIHALHDWRNAREPSVRPDQTH